MVIVGPYNAQVDRLAEDLGAHVRVGTVDKFQGQEAAVSMYSLASSSAADAPRGRCIAIVVASPELSAGVPDAGADALCQCVLPVPGIGDGDFGPRSLWITAHRRG